MGYMATMKNIYYLDMESNHMKTALHARFDEGMNDLDDPTPNSRQLRLAMGKKIARGFHIHTDSCFP